LHWRLADSTGLETAAIDTPTGHASPLQDCASVRLALTPIDSSGIMGAPVTVGPFRVGNTPPNAVPQPYLQDRRGQIPIVVKLSDAARDPADLEIQFRRFAGDPWRAAHIVLGLTQGV